MPMKIFLTILVVLGLVIGAGISGASFTVWPTAWPEQKLNVSREKIEALTRLKEERKFVEDREHFYYGAPNEGVRASAQQRVDAVLDSLVTELRNNSRRLFVLATIKHALPSLDNFDSEERDQALVYFERVLSLLEISGSGELFNVWRYGFSYGWFFRA